MKTLWHKYREIILYLIFGVLTTVVGMGSYFLFLWLAETAFQITPDRAAYNAVRAVAQVLQWILAVLFAYFTNKRWVFRAEGGNETKRITEFFGARLFSLGADTLVTFGTVFLLGACGYKSFGITALGLTVTFTPDLWGKLAAAVVVIILNYVLSKFIVFKSSTKKTAD